MISDTEEILILDVVEKGLRESYHLLGGLLQNTNDEDERAHFAVALLRELHVIDTQMAELRDCVQLRAHEAVRAADRAAMERAFESAPQRPPPTRKRTRRAA